MKFDEKLKVYNEKIALIDEKGHLLTYNDLDKKVQEIKEHFGDSKTLILVLCKTNIETVLGYLASLQGNHTVMMMNTDIDKTLLDSIIEKYDPEYIWRPRNETDNYNIIYEYLTYQLIKRDINDNNLIHDELSLLLSTSGSTGSPKFVKLSKKNIYSNTASIVEYLKITSIERTITTLPFHYSYGLSILNTHLAVGATLLLTEKSIVSRDFWAFFKEYKATSLSGVPYTYEMLKKIKFFNMDLPSLKTLTQAGGKLNSKLVQEFADYSKNKGINFFVMYGQTEATARISYLPPKYSQSYIKSIGIPIPNGKIVIVDENGVEIDENNIEGELVYIGNNVMMGYANERKDLLLKDQCNGRLKTGDIGYKDSDGFFYITGRTKRFIKIFGNRVNLDEIEHSLKKNNLECLCTGNDDKLKVAVLNESIIDSIKKYLSSKYKFHHSAYDVKLVEKFPITSSGKVEYNKLFES